MSQPLTNVGSRTAAYGPAEWGLTLMIGLIWGSAFLWIALGVDDLAPGVVAFGRVALGAGALAAVNANALADPRVRVSVEDVSAFVPFTGNVRDTLCVQDERVVGNDNIASGQDTAPPLTTAQVCSSPAASAVTPLPSAIVCTGKNTSVVVPSPN